MRKEIAAVVVAAAFASAQEPGPTGPALVIVAPRALVPALKDFAAFKRERLPTELMELEDVLARTKGADDPERLKVALYQRWVHGRAGGAPDLGYVLLVGDADVMPVRYMVLDRNTEPAFNYAFYPSDLYYADLAKADGSFEDWNGAKDDFHAGYVGEVRGEHFKTDPINYDGISYTPEIGVGRWPVGAVEELKVVAAKTMAYERSLAERSTEPAAVALIATGGWVENRPAMDSFAATLGWPAQKRYWGRTEGADATPPPDAAQVMGLLEEGPSLVLHSGHGSDHGWDGSISSKSIAALHNGGKLSILMSAGCSTARLATLPPYEAYVDAAGVEHKGTNDGEVFSAPPPPPAPYQKGKYNPSGLGEQLLRAGPAGAVAYIGCNTGSQPCGMTLMEGLVDSIAQRQKDAAPVRLGDCWKDAETYYFQHEHLATLTPTESWYPASIFFQGMKFMLYGDPSIPVRVPRR